MEGDQTATEGEGDKSPQPTLRELLLATSLTVYEEALRQHGADDVEQLKHLEDDLFDSLCLIVGLKSKPFHLLRFEKALRRNASRFSLETRQESCSASTSEGMLLTASTSTTNAILARSGISTTLPVGHPSGRDGSLSRLLSALPPPPQPALSAISPLEGGNGRDPVVGAGTMMSSEMVEPQGSEQLADQNVCLPAYLHPKSNTSDFSQLVDDSTPIQQSLGSSPISALIWDQKRANIIRYAAAIYGRKVNSRKSGELTSHEANVNEAAAQLCLRDPTLLVRREELFLLARRAVREGGFSYVHGFSRSKHGSTASSAAQECSEDAALQQGDGSSGEPKSVRDRRKQRLEELQVLITRNKDEQRTKMAALNQAQDLRNFSQAYQLQTDIEALGNVCLTLETEFGQLKRRQKRSDRYFESKAKRPAPSSESPSSECQLKRFSPSNLTPAAMVASSHDIATSQLTIQPTCTLPARSEIIALPRDSIRHPVQLKGLEESAISVSRLPHSSALQISQQIDTIATSAPHAKSDCSPSRVGGSVMTYDSGLAKSVVCLESVRFSSSSEAEQKPRQDLPSTGNLSSSIPSGISSSRASFPTNGRLLSPIQNQTSSSSNPLSRDHSELSERLLLPSSLPYSGNLLVLSSPSLISVSSTLAATNGARPSSSQYAAVPASLFHPLATVARPSKHLLHPTATMTVSSTQLIKPSANAMDPSFPTSVGPAGMELSPPSSSYQLTSPSALLVGSCPSSLGSSSRGFLGEDGKRNSTKSEHYEYQATSAASNGQTVSGLYVEDFFTLPSTS